MSRIHETGRFAGIFAAAAFLIWLGSEAAWAAERPGRLDHYIAGYTQQLDPQNPQYRTGDFFNSLSALYDGDMLFVRGLYTHAFFFIYFAANFYFPSTVGLAKSADAEFLIILTGLHADTEEGLCRASEIFIKPGDDRLLYIKQMLASYDAAIAFHEFEKQETGLAMPPEFLAELRSKRKGAEYVQTLYAQSTPGACLDLKQALQGFDEPERLMGHIQSAPEFLPGRCPYYVDTGVDIWPDEEEVINTNTTLGMEYINAYMRKIPIEYMRVPGGRGRSLTEVEPVVRGGDFEKIAPRFIQARHALLTADFYFSKKQYERALEHYDVAVSNIPSFISLVHRADARLMLLAKGLSGPSPPREADRVKFEKQLAGIIREYEASLAVYKFETCEGLKGLHIMEMAWVGDKAKCLKTLPGKPSPEALSACLKNDQPVYKHCVDFVNNPLWPCPGDEL